MKGCFRTSLLQDLLLLTLPPRAHPSCTHRLFCFAVARSPFRSSFPFSAWWPCMTHPFQVRDPEQVAAHVLARPVAAGAGGNLDIDSALAHPSHHFDIVVRGTVSRAFLRTVTTLHRPCGALYSVPRLGTHADWCLPHPMLCPKLGPPTAPCMTHPPQTREFIVDYLWEQVSPAC